MGLSTGSTVASFSEKRMRVFSVSAVQAGMLFGEQSMRPYPFMIRSSPRRFFIRQDEALSEEQVRWVEEKLPELNRVPLKAVLERFCTHYKLDLSAFWPVFGLSSEVGLAKIRNRLVHGERLLEAVSSHALIAAEHLRWVLEAMLIAVLGWPLEKAAIRPDRLSNETAMSEWRAAKAALEM